MRILILGGTGAMGAHVSELLTRMGHQVTVTSRRQRASNDPRLEYRTGNAKDGSFLDGLLSTRWDAIIDFMIWSTPEFRNRAASFLNATGQYVFVSSYRVYADSPVIREESPRLLDVVDDPDYLATDEYALAKARCEDMLFQSGTTNWTIVRPAVTYDGGGRFQLAVHESDAWLWRARRHIPVPLPDEILQKQGTMTWGGDVARMIALLIGNDQAMGEAFTVSTSEHQTWRTVADIYAQIVPLVVKDCPMDEFEQAHGAKYQIRYDRMYDRVIDNNKILTTTGLTQEQLTDTRTGLQAQLRAYLNGHENEPHLESPGRQGRLDRLIGGTPSLKHITKTGAKPTLKYLIRRFL
ncbi:NAD-dependent epimerase/dehydratase family protein [Bifidobacterium eulemuris]|uniref:Epimerase n=1 Tax=Bifidobacterium eulemuris TaxID=1765219 RepID=A0A261GBD4_9BIFI|nr:NAD-dependent epimerase/dehydratase family protein [Bifidobacterium eulemuris]OZG68553.1 epimerase [Bifidobacterium eulemuris]QOL32682.1 NAD-dependent epimerase/dehydratase family protein [Bifidobacterium eulemuris]